MVLFSLMVKQDLFARGGQKKQAQQQVAQGQAPQDLGIPAPHPFPELKENFLTQWKNSYNSAGKDVHGIGGAIDAVAQKLIPYIKDKYTEFSKNPLSEDDIQASGIMLLDPAFIPGGYAIFQDLLTHLSTIYAYRVKEIQDKDMKEEFILKAGHVFDRTKKDIEIANTDARGMVCQEGYINRLLYNVLEWDADDLWGALGSDDHFQEKYLSALPDDLLFQHLDPVDGKDFDENDKNQHTFLWDTCSALLKRGNNLQANEVQEYFICKGLSTYLDAILPAYDLKNQKKDIPFCPLACGALELYGIFSASSLSWKQDHEKLFEGVFDRGDTFKKCLEKDGPEVAKTMEESFFSDLLKKHSPDVKKEDS